MCSLFWRQRLTKYLSLYINYFFCGFFITLKIVLYILNSAINVASVNQNNNIISYCYVGFLIFCMFIINF